MEEKKTYSVIGTVEIGTDEYRDLIVTATRLKAENDALYLARWNAEAKLHEAEKKLAETEKKLADVTERYNELLREEAF